MSPRPALLALVLASLAAAPLGAQRDDAVPPRTIRGTALTTRGAPLGDVAVRVERLGDGTPVARATTGPTGLFALRAPRGGARLVALRLGYAPETLLVAGGRSAPVVLRLREAPFSLSPALVRAEPATSAASASVVRRLDLALRPRESSQELLRLVPGLVIAQHAGGGKAEQIFLRGFDADHGTDVAVSVDGTPVNLPSHAHGQGYADLHFLMPEVVERIDVRKGAYDARDGDFATAGAVAFRTRDRVDAASATARAGSFDTRHLVALAPFGGDAAHAGGYLAASAHYTDGPFLRPQDYRRGNLFGKLTAPIGDLQLTATLSSYAGRWNASGEVPARAVARGLIPRFGQIDDSEGGSTERHDASLALSPRAAGGTDWQARLWATRYRFRLFSDFTFFLVDTANGDGVEQSDDRVAGGATARVGRALRLRGRATAWELGADARADRADVALYHQVARRRLAARSAAAVDIASVAPWARLDLQLTDRLHLEAGLRADALRFAVRDRAPRDASAMRAAGARSEAVVSPRASLRYDLDEGTALFADAGRGFHSNDARDAVLASSRSHIIPRSTGAELGLRHTGQAGSIAGALWMTDLESELVWVGDEGTTEPSGRTRRVGVDVEARARIRSWLWADVDLTLARGRFRDAPANARLIPLAPTRTATVGLTVRDVGAPALRGLEGGLRVRHVGSRAASEDGAVRALGYTLGEAFASLPLGSRARLVGSVDNLVDARWNEAQFATTSRLRHEPAPVTELHFTPGAPRAVQFGLELRF